jgi:hypothetical protein
MLVEETKNFLALQGNFVVFLGVFVSVLSGKRSKDYKNPKANSGENV